MDDMEDRICPWDYGSHEQEEESSSDWLEVTSPIAENLRRPGGKLLR